MQRVVDRKEFVLNAGEKQARYAGVLDIARESVLCQKNSLAALPEGKIISDILREVQLKYSAVAFFNGKLILYIRQRIIFADDKFSVLLEYKFVCKSLDRKSVV